MKTYKIGDKVVSKATYFRSKQSQSVSSSVSNETVSPKVSQSHETKCHSCNKPVNELICICYECCMKGVTHKSLGLDERVCDPQELKYGNPTRKDIDDAVSRGQKFIPNWYTSGFKSRKESHAILSG